MILISQRMKNAPLKALSILAGFVVSLAAIDAVAVLSDNAIAMILAGRPSGEHQAAAIEHSPEWLGAVEATSITRSWQSPASFFSKGNVAKLRSFAAGAFPEAYANTHRLLYLLGGADFPFASILFPEMDDLVMVGLEPVGALPNVEGLAADHLLRRKMGRIAFAFHNLSTNTYFVTVNMAKDLDDFGISTMLAVGAAAMGHPIISVEPVALDARGGLVNAAPGALGVRIRYVKENGREGRIIYLQHDLSNAALAQQPALAAFLKNAKFDTAFYKAAMFVSHDVARFSQINSIVTSSVHYLVQSDDGLPLSALDRRRWDIQLYGLYTRPGPTFHRSEEADYLQAFVTSISASNNRQAAMDMNKVWVRGDLCLRYTDAPRDPFIRWMGYVPFRFGYGPYNSPHLSLDLRAKVSNIIYGIAR